jgi:hypothetical protein
MQISAGGKTTSLGDHDTEEEAARAFDRAAINKGGTAAKTNFAMREYTDEISDLQGDPHSSWNNHLRFPSYRPVCTKGLTDSPNSLLCLEELGGLQNMFPGPSFQAYL